MTRHKPTIFCFLGRDAAELDLAARQRMAARYGRAPEFVACVSAQGGESSQTIARALFEVRRGLDRTTARGRAHGEPAVRPSGAVPAVYLVEALSDAAGPGLLLAVAERLRQRGGPWIGPSKLTALLWRAKPSIHGHESLDGGRESLDGAQPDRVRLRWVEAAVERGLLDGTWIVAPAALRESEHERIAELLALLTDADISSALVSRARSPGRASVLGVATRDLDSTLLRADLEELFLRRLSAALAGAAAAETPVAAPIKAETRESAPAGALGARVSSWSPAAVAALGAAVAIAIAVLLRARGIVEVIASGFLGAVAALGFWRLLPDLLLRGAGKTGVEIAPVIEARRALVEHATRAGNDAAALRAIRDDVDSALPPGPFAGSPALERVFAERGGAVEVERLVEELRTRAMASPGDGAGSAPTPHTVSERLLRPARERAAAWAEQALRGLPMAAYLEPGAPVVRRVLEELASDAALTWPARGGALDELRCFTADLAHLATTGDLLAPGERRVTCVRILRGVSSRDLADGGPR